MQERRQEERRKSKERRNGIARFPTESANPSVTEMRAVFHRIWTSHVGKPGYVKSDWMLLRQMIHARCGIDL